MTDVVLFDWGDTLMVDFPGVPGRMCDWETVAAVDGAEEALRFVSRRARTYVATGAADSTEADIAAALRRVGLDRYLAGIFCTANLGVGKGDPDFFARILDRLDVAPERVTLVGDSLEKDIEPARALGIATVWLVPDGAEAPGDGVRVIASLRDLCSQADSGRVPEPAP